MRSRVVDVLPRSLRRSLEKFGTDIAIARKKRGLTIAMMAERVNVAQATIKRVEKGDASVRLGVYAMTLFVLGFGDRIRDLIDAGRDETGLLLDQEERIPQRVRPKKTPQPL